MMIRGVGASAGIGIGRAVCVRPQALAFSQVPAGTPRQEKDRMHFHGNVRIDKQKVFPHHFGFQSANGGMVRNDLPVDVGEAHAIAIHKNKRSDTCAGQCIHSMAANASQAKHSHFCTGEAIHCFLPQKKPGARKFIWQRTSPLYLITAAKV